MNIQFVRLDEHVCEILNDMARDQRRPVSDLVNEILREHLERHGQERPDAAGAN